ncbi:MAG: DUF5994 family protein [Actinomycetota bacterium]|nr:DUF5994 family protein [Actinomycetota bacterium]
MASPALVRTVSPLRLALTSQLTRANRLDGAWWPYSTDVTLELAPLLDAVARRLGRVRGVLLNRSEWAPTPLDWIPCGSRRTRISWYGLQDSDIAILIGDNDKRLGLLIIPPCTEAGAAVRAMEMAATTGNSMSGTDTLRAVGIDREASLSTEGTA